MNTGGTFLITSALAAIRPEHTITNKWLLRLGLGALFAAVMLLITHEYIQQVWHIPIIIPLASLIPAFFLLCVGGRETETVLKKVDRERIIRAGLLSEKHFIDALP